jgi:hypothetical protein
MCDLRAFVDAVIVPALLERFLREHQVHHVRSRDVTADAQGDSPTPHSSACV